MSSLVARYTRVLRRTSLFIVLLWSALLGLGAWQAVYSISRTTTAFDAPPGSLADQGDKAMAKYFGRQGVSASFALYVQNNNNDSIWYEKDDFQRFSNLLNASLSSLSVAGCGEPCVIDFVGYSMLADLGLQAFGNRFVSGNGSFLTCQVNVAFARPEAISWATQAQEIVDDILTAGNFSSFQATLLGIPSFIPVMIHDVEINMGIIDAIVVPVAFCVFLLMVRSFRLLVLPIVSMAGSVIVSFSLVTLMTYATQVMAFIPSLLMSLVLSTSFDYTLFLLLRYREELSHKKTNDQAVEIMLRTAGETIGLSGAILGLTFVAMAIVPLNFVRMTGVIAAIAITLTLILNLTLIPAILLLFGNFFSRCVEPFECCGRRFGAGSEGAIKYDLLHEQRVSESLSDEDLHDMRRSNWYRLGIRNTTTGSAVFFVILCLAVVAPFGYFAVTYRQSDAIVQDLPRGTLVYEAYQNFSSAFGPGLMFATSLLLTSGPNQTVFDLPFFERVYAIVEAISIGTNTSSAFWSGPAYSSQFSPKQLYQLHQLCQTRPSATSLCFVLNTLGSTFTNAAQTATLLTFAGDFDPLAPPGYIWLQNARKAFNNATFGTEVTGFFVGEAPESWDAVASVTAWFPYVAIVSLSLVLVMIAVVFRSVLIPLRTVLSLTMTVGFVFGVADLVYNYGILDWFPLQGLHSSQGITWLVPVVTFQLVIGISLDYDCFLLMRVYELRQEGFSTQDALRVAVFKTGPVISVAGLIMAVAFSGLLFSSVTALNQMGLILGLSVIIDTFFLRTLFVPSIMGLFGEANWWPRKFDIKLVEILPKPDVCCVCTERPKKKEYSYQEVN